MASIRKIQKLRAKCKKYELSAPDEFWQASDKELSQIYNGAGPDWLPSLGRFILTLFLWLFAPAFLIHDFRFKYSDKTQFGFEWANTEMMGNMLMINSAMFPREKWYWRTIHDKWHVKAKLAYYACKEGGWSAWCDK